MLTMHAKTEPHLNLDAIKAAHERIKDAIFHTPTRRSDVLSQMTGAEIYLKYENQQRTAAYKERGALNYLLQMDEVSKKRGVIAASAGNHSQGLSYHGTRLGVPVTIVMPTTTPMVKVAKTEGLGGNVVLHGSNYDEAFAHALKLSGEHGLELVHPFDNVKVAAGQGTVAVEMLAAVPDLDVLVIPVGGGGLISGCAVAAKAINPKIRVIGVQSNRYPAFYNFKHHKDVDGGGSTLAEGIAVKMPGELGKWAVEHFVDDVRIVNEAVIESAIALLLDAEKTVVEGAGASGLATVLPAAFGGKPRAEFAGKKVGIILTGGNIDPRLLANVILGNLARTGKLGRIAIRITDEVGQLGKIIDIFTECRANIIEIAHQRIFGGALAKDLATEIEYEVRDVAGGELLVERLLDAGYSFDRVLVSGERRRAYRKGEKPNGNAR